MPEQLLELMCRRVVEFAVEGSERDRRRLGGLHWCSRSGADAGQITALDGTNVDHSYRKHCRHGDSF